MSARTTEVCTFSYLEALNCESLVITIHNKFAVQQASLPSFESIQCDETYFSVRANLALFSIIDMLMATLIKALICVSVIQIYILIRSVCLQPDRLEIPPKISAVIFINATRVTVDGETRVVNVALSHRFSMSLERRSCGGSRQPETALLPGSTPPMPS
jgi:hypothetical protein